MGENGTLKISLFGPGPKWHILGVKGAKYGKNVKKHGPKIDSKVKKPQKAKNH